MPQIYHQSVEEILKAATPEQRLLWNYVFLRWGERVAISQFYYCGSFAASGELLVYSANRMYVGYFLNTSNEITGAAVGARVMFYNEANVLYFTSGNNSSYWDATAAAARFVGNSYSIKNMLFSRLDRQTTAYLEFIGYRIGI